MKQYQQHQQYIEEAEQLLLHTYNRYQIVLERGEDVYLYDINGKNIWIFVPGLQCLPLDTAILNIRRR